MKGQYAKQQKEINGDSEEARESMINRLFCQHANPEETVMARTDSGSEGPSPMHRKHTRNVRRYPGFSVLAFPYLDQTIGFTEGFYDMVLKTALKKRPQTRGLRSNGGNP